jgi:hypothetical protein
MAANVLFDHCRLKLLINFKRQRQLWAGALLRIVIGWASALLN